MIDNSRVVLENNIEYIVVDKIESNSQFFVYLVNPNNSTDFCIRKEIEENGETFLVGLDNKEEADFALEIFQKKQQND